jgi:hypothetical protein
MRIMRSYHARLYRQPFSKFGFRERLNRPRRCNTRRDKSICKKALRAEGRR